MWNLKGAHSVVVVLWVVVVVVTVAFAAVGSLSYVVDQVGPVECEQPGRCLAVVSKGAEVQVNGVVLGL